MSNRSAHILASLSQLLARQLRMSPGELDPRRPFLELGADSLVLLEMSHAVERDHGVRLAPHQLFEQVTDLATLAEFVAHHEVRPEVRPEVCPEVSPEVGPEVWPEVCPEVRPEVC